MPSFADSIFLFVLALLLFGPKKLPVLARELGKWMGEFRRASNEFKMQMEEELRISEQADRQKQIAAMEAAAPVPPPLGEPEHVDLPRAVEETSEPPSMIHSAESDTSLPPHERIPDMYASAASVDPATASISSPTGNSFDKTPETLDGVRPVPIATSGSLKMMPPDTGLPTPRSREASTVSQLLGSIPEASASGAATATSPETAAHGD